jgi:hypothetical protein
MVKFVDIDPTKIPFNREGRRGRVSYPILKSFLETNKHCVKLDRTGIQQSFQSLYSVLRSYIQNHRLPVKIFSASGEIYLMRLDLTPEGAPIPDWDKEAGVGIRTTEGHTPTEAHMQPAPITPEEIKARAAVERGMTTK